MVSRIVLRSHHAQYNTYAHAPSVDIGSDGRKLLAQARRGQRSDPASGSTSSIVGVQHLNMDLNPSMMIYGSFIVRGRLLYIATVLRLRP